MEGQKHTDHLGHEFPSLRQMCNYWHIGVSTYTNRINNKWTQKDALTTKTTEPPKNAKPCFDHEGNKFSSLSEMCRHWGVPKSTYVAYKNQGWTTEEALTSPRKPAPPRKRKCNDHLGREFPSVSEMCKYWNIDTKLFITRIHKLKWTLERALTTKEPLSNSIEVTDYKNRVFPSIKDFCEYYGAEPYKAQGKELTEKRKEQIYTSLFKKNKTIGRFTIIKNLGFPYALAKENGNEIIVDIEEVLKEYHSKK